MNPGQIRTTHDQLNKDMTVDFLDFNEEKLYFDEPVSAAVENLLEQASMDGTSDAAEVSLMRAYFLEPEHLTVLVALYRYLYYKHRYDEALMVADRAMETSARQLGLRHSWNDMTVTELGYGVQVSMGLTRFYLHALKASGFMYMRLGDMVSALERLNKIAELDQADQFGSSHLIRIAKKFQSEQQPESKALKQA
jgi:tetratricopeptide (TPR) repeat protein